MSRFVGCLLTGIRLRAHFLLDVTISWLFVDRNLSKTTLYWMSGLGGCLLTGTRLRAHFLLDVTISWLFVDRNLSKSTLSVGCHDYLIVC